MITGPELCLKGGNIKTPPFLLRYVSSGQIEKSPRFTGQLPEKTSGRILLLKHLRKETSYNDRPFHKNPSQPAGEEKRGHSYEKREYDQHINSIHKIRDLHIYVPEKVYAALLNRYT